MTQSIKKRVNHSHLGNMSNRELKQLFVAALADLRAVAADVANVQIVTNNLISAVGNVQTMVNNLVLADANIKNMVNNLVSAVTNIDVNCSNAVVNVAAITTNVSAVTTNLNAATFVAVSNAALTLTD